jgi:uncharacterized repeat protein (TIGR01451 family)
MAVYGARRIGMKRLLVLSTSVLSILALMFAFALTIHPAAAQDTDLTFDLTGSTAKAKIGTFVEFTVSLQNTGSETIPGLRVDLGLPDALDARSVHCPGGTGAGESVTSCDLGDVAPGMNAEVQFYVEVGAKEPNGPVTATATSGGTDIATDQLAALKIIGPPNR